MNKDLIIIGASGHGKVVADIALKLNEWENIFFLDDNKDLNHVMNLRVIGKTEDYKKYIKTAEIFVAIGSNNVRKKIYEELKSWNVKIPKIIHPKAVIGEGVIIQQGTVIMAGAVVNPCSSIGESCIVNTGATIGHDCEINDISHIAPGVHIAGTVKIGEKSWIGVGAIVSNNIEIESNIIIGAGAVVTKNIRESGTYVGIPARRIKIDENFNFS